MPGQFAHNCPATVLFGRLLLKFLIRLANIATLRLMEPKLEKLPGEYFIDYFLRMFHGDRKQAFGAWLGNRGLDVTPTDLAARLNIPVWTVRSWRNSSMGPISDLGLFALRWYEDHAEYNKENFNKKLVDIVSEIR